MEMESVFLDNLPDTANMILNILWDRNEEMCTAELTEAVNEVYNRRWEKGLIQEFINLGWTMWRRKGMDFVYITLH